MATPYPDDDMDDALADLMRHLDRVDEKHQAQRRRLTSVEAQMDRLIRHNDPALFGAWLRDYDHATAPNPVEHKHKLRLFMEHDIPTYIAWLQRLREAYFGVCAEFMQKITGPIKMVFGNHLWQHFRTDHQSDSVFRARFRPFLPVEIGTFKLCRKRS